MFSSGYSWVRPSTVLLPPFRADSLTRVLRIPLAIVALIVLSLFRRPPVAILGLRPAVGSQGTGNLHLDRLQVVPNLKKKKKKKTNRLNGLRDPYGQVVPAEVVPFPVRISAALEIKGLQSTY